MAAEIEQRMTMKLDAPFSDVFAAERKGIVEALGCVIDSNQALYAAAPITGGPRFVDWYMTQGKALRGKSAYDQELRNYVILPNCGAAARFAGQLRAQTGKIVIDPSRFLLDHWSQEDYHLLWGEVIKRFVSEVHFSKGWFLSLGCAKELFAAATFGVATYEGLDSVLSLPKGVRQIKMGVEKLRLVGFPHEALALVSSRLNKLLSADNENRDSIKRRR